MMHRHTVQLTLAGRNEWSAWNVHRPKKPAGDVRPQQSRSEQFSIGRNHPAATEAQLKEILLNSTGRVRSSIGSAGTAMLFAVTGAVLLGAAVLVAFLLRPPLLGWVGFAIVCAIVIGLATFAAVALPRLRVNPQQPAAASDADARLLVVADEHCGSPGLWQSVESRLAGAVAVHLVVPVRVSHLHYLTNDEASESRDAEDRVDLAVGLLRQHGVSVTGGIGSDDPLESMTDALGSFPATRVLLATSTGQDSYWLEQDLLAKAQALTTLEVSHVVVPPTTAPSEPSRLATGDSRQRDQG
ncbi:MAG TPA: hypothetical protein VII54_01825 [Gaiellaceae bacterium]